MIKNPNIPQHSSKADQRIGPYSGYRDGHSFFPPERQGRGGDCPSLTCLPLSSVLAFTPGILYPKPNPKPETLNPQPLNPGSEFLNPTVDPEPPA